MRTSLLLVVMVLLVMGLLAGCAAGPNQLQGTPGEHGVAGFWLGVWHGFIAAFVFVASLFRHDLGIYELHNNGAWYNFGYLFGLACFWGGGHRAAGNTRKVAGEAK